MPAEPAPQSVLQRLATRDLPASLVVFLVAVPLSLGIALASNAPIMGGLIAAAVGGIVVGCLAGAPLQVSGPAAGLVVTVFALTESLGGDWRMVCAITAMAGLVQLALGALKVARSALAISPAVVHGMLAGIGILIALGQLHVVLGGSPQSSALANLRELPQQLRELHGSATALGLLTIGLLVAWTFLPAKGFLRKIPAPLVAVGAATVVALAFGLDAERVSLGADGHVHAVTGGRQLPDAPGSAAGGGGLLAAIQLPRWPGQLGWVGIVTAVLTLALVASVESLLCAVATDKLHGGARANLDRELLAQGAGNTLSGLLGGLPVTGVIVRSAANIDAGATTRWSGVLHGVWVLLFVAALPFAIEAIPKAALAGLLVFVGVRLVNPRHARSLRTHGELPIYLITIGGVVGIDLLSGVALGFGCALARLLWRLAHVVVEVAPPEADGAVRVTIRGALSFLGVPRLVAALEQVPAQARVDVDLDLDSLDHAGWEALEGWKDAHERGGGQVALEGLPAVWHPGPHLEPVVVGAPEAELELSHAR